MNYATYDLVLHHFSPIYTIVSESVHVKFMFSSSFVSENVYAIWVHYFDKIYISLEYDFCRVVFLKLMLTVKHAR